MSKTNFLKANCLVIGFLAFGFTTAPVNASEKCKSDCGIGFGVCLKECSNKFPRDEEAEKACHAACETGGKACVNWGNS